VNGVTAYLFLKDKDKHLNAKGAYLHLATDALVSLCVVIGGILILYTHWLWLDSVLSLAIAVVILASTWGLLMDSLRLSLDGVQNGFWAYAHNPIEYSKAVNCPVLLMYGRKDETVSEEDTRLIFSNLQSSLKELKVYPNAAHENFLTQYRREWTSDVTAFVEKTEK
ncbi:MAG: cation transporter, partial [Saprospiraceae bacterium]